MLALGRFVGVVLLVGLASIPLGLIPASFLDRGPGGEVRFSWFSIALAGFDPFIWRSARNSAVVAALVAAGSAAVGVTLGVILARWRFWGRPILRVLALAPLAAGVLLIAPGLDGLALGPDSVDWLAARRLLGYSCEDLARWALLVWIGVATGAPIALLATTSALARLEPAWADAARTEGAGRSRIWLDLTWPVLRPEVARAAAAIFALEIIEPVGPIVLGLRRTLVAQILDAATRLDDPTRAATLAAFSVAIAVLGRVVILRWGGRPCLGPRPDPPTPRPMAGWRVTLALVAILGAWLTAALGPAVATLRRVFGTVEGSGAGRWADMTRAWLGDPEALGWAWNSAVTAALAVALDLAILAAFTGRGSRRGLGRIVRGIGIVPPTAFAVGALAIPWLVAAMADRSGAFPGRWLRAIALELSPGRSPGFLLIATLAAGRLSMLLAASTLARSRSSPALEDLGRLAGLSPWRARRAGDGLWFGLVPAGPATLGLVLAATNLAPSLLLTSFSERRTLGPAAFGLILQGHESDPRLGGLIAAILAAKLAGFWVASRSRGLKFEDWFRG